MAGVRVVNFGRNVLFTSDRVFAPEREEDVLALLSDHVAGVIRARGALHSWSECAATNDVVLDLRNLTRVHFRDDKDGEFALVDVQAGCTIEALLSQLHRRGITLPTIGTITRQTVAGAVSTATHGSGRSSLSHYVHSLRCAAFDATGTPTLHHWKAPEDVRMASCAVGCGGIIVSITFRCVPRRDVVERVSIVDSLDAVLATSHEHELQEFALVPHVWRYVVYARKPLPPRDGWRWWRGWPRRFAYRLYKAAFIDRLFHWLVVMALVPQVWTFARRLSNAVIALLFKGMRLIVQPGIWLTHGDGVVDRSEHTLTRKHFLFRHVEMEVFVPGTHVRAATALLQYVVKAFADRSFTTSSALDADLARVGLDVSLHRGTYTHHYPLYFRRVHPDDSAMAMTSDAAEPYYAIGVFCYLRDRRAYYAFARFLAVAMMKLYDARLHWGKYLPDFPQSPLTARDFEPLYPNLAAFRDWCRAIDPHGVFRNEYARRILGFERPSVHRYKRSAAASLSAGRTVSRASSANLRPDLSEKGEPV